MSALAKRIAKLEQERSYENPERVFVVITAMEPSPNGAQELDEPIGLAQFSAQGPFFPRLPKESINELHKRAARTHPEVLVWVTRYEGDGYDACGVSQPKTQQARSPDFYSDHQTKDDHGYH